MSKTQLEIRRMVRGDAEQLLKIHEGFVKNYVGPLERNVRFYQRAARRKDGLRWVAVNHKGEIAGYIIAFYNKRRRLGVITEIVVDSSLDFVSVARVLVERVYGLLVEKGAVTVQAPTMLNPKYSLIFPNIGFFKVESQDVFMFATNNVPRFLDEIKPIITTRLKRVQGWNGTLELRCEEHSIFFRKDSDKVQLYDWTNQDIDFRILMDEYTLAAVLLGVTESEAALTDRQFQVETKLSKSKTKELLGSLCPKRQFLAFNFW